MVSESSLSRRICVFKLIPKRTFWIFQPIWSMQRTSTFHHLLLHVMTIIFWFYQGFGWTLSLLKCRVNTFHPDFLSSQLWLWRRPCVILLFFKKSQWQLRRYHCGWYQTGQGSTPQGRGEEWVRLGHLITIDHMTTILLCHWFNSLLKHWRSWSWQLASIWIRLFNLIKNLPVYG